MTGHCINNLSLQLQFQVLFTIYFWLDHYLVIFKYQPIAGAYLDRKQLWNFFFFLVSHILLDMIRFRLWLGHCNICICFDLIHCISGRMFCVVVNLRSSASSNRCSYKLIMYLAPPNFPSCLKSFTMTSSKTIPIASHCHYLVLHLAFKLVHSNRALSYFNGVKTFAGTLFLSIFLQILTKDILKIKHS